MKRPARTSYVLFKGPRSIEKRKMGKHVNHLVVYAPSPTVPKVHVEVAILEVSK